MNLSDHSILLPQKAYVKLQLFPETFYEAITGFYTSHSMAMLVNIK